MRRACAKAGYDRTDRSAARAAWPDLDAAQHILILADASSDLQLPGEVLTLMQGIADALGIESAEKFRPSSDRCVVPPERVHVAPRTAVGSMLVKMA